MGSRYSLNSEHVPSRPIGNPKGGCEMLIAMLKRMTRLNIISCNSGARQSNSDLLDLLVIVALGLTIVLVIVKLYSPH